MSDHRQPSLYISHGGGPCFWMDMPEPIGPHGFDGLRDYLAGILKTLPSHPKAIVVISAHWEQKVPTVSTAVAPSMLFDYYGFPEHTYRLNYPAPGSPPVAMRVRSLLKAAGIATATDDTRGFDHGVFVPFLILDAKAEIPVVMLSLQQDLDPARHIEMGEALAPLREEGVLIIGSGSSYHNLRDYFSGHGHEASLFDDWLYETVEGSDSMARNAQLTNWTDAPAARICHPREEHLLPLMVAAGAGGKDKGRRTFSGAIGGKAVSCFMFG